MRLWEKWSVVMVTILRKLEQSATPEYEVRALKWFLHPQVQAVLQAKYTVRGRKLQPKIAQMQNFADYSCISYHYFLVEELLAAVSRSSWSSSSSGMFGWSP